MIRIVMKGRWTRLIIIRGRNEQWKGYFRLGTLVDVFSCPAMELNAVSSSVVGSIDEVS